MTRALLTAIISMLLYTAASGQQSGLDFLNIGPNSLALSTADARTAAKSGSASIYFNPALLSLEQSNTIDVNYTRWIADQVNLFGGINSVNNGRAFAFSVYSATIDNIEQRDRPGPATGEFEVSYFSIAGAFAYDFKVFSLGGAVQFLNEENFIERASGYAINAGIARNFADRLTLGASLLNAGEMGRLINQRSQLPAQLRFGASGLAGNFKLPGKNDFYFDVNLHADYVYQLEELNTLGITAVNDDQAFFNLGTTLMIAEVVELMAGYRTGDSSRRMNFGLGIDTGEVVFNYALVPFTTGFGTAHSIGLQYRF
jgi:hypothetical protein